METMSTERTAVRATLVSLIEAHEARIAALRVQIDDYQKSVESLKLILSDGYMDGLFDQAEPQLQFRLRPPVRKVLHARITVPSASGSSLDQGLQAAPTPDFPKKTPSKVAMMWLKALKEQNHTIQTLAAMLPGDPEENAKKARAFANNYKARYSFLDRDGSGMISITPRGLEFLQHFEDNQSSYTPSEDATDLDEDDDEL